MWNIVCRFVPYRQLQLSADFFSVFRFYSENARMCPLWLAQPTANHRVCFALFHFPSPFLYAIFPVHEKSLIHHIPMLNVGRERGKSFRIPTRWVRFFQLHLPSNTNLRVERVLCGGDKKFFFLLKVSFYTPMSCVVQSLRICSHSLDFPITY